MDTTVNGSRKSKQQAPPPAGLAEHANVTTVKLSRTDFAPKVISIPMVIEQLSPLIVNKFSNKAKEQMLAAQTQQARGKKPPKDPVANYENAKHKDAKGRDCFPIGGIRNAMIAAARNVDGLTMAALKQAIFIEGPDGPAQTLLPIDYERVEMGEDPVRNDSGTADIRHRPYYHGWSINFTLHVLENVVSLQQAYQLLELAGFSVGIGEWRPAGKDGLGGPYGRFRIRMENAV